MIKWIKNHFLVKLNNPSEEFTLGIYCQTGDAYKIDEETEEIDYDVEPIEVYRLVLGFLIFNIEIYW
jgi:hypothetical protein